MEVTRKIWKGLDQFAEVSRTGKGIEEVHNVITGILLIFGVAGSRSTGDNRAGTSMDGTGEEKRGTAVCGMKDMSPCSGIRPDQVFDQGPVLGPDHEPPGNLPWD